MTIPIPQALFELVTERVSKIRSRRALKRRMKAMLRGGEPDGVDAVWVLEWIALSQNVSVPMAWDMFLEAVAEGKLTMWGERTEGGGLERVPPEVFRDRPV